VLVLSDIKFASAGIEDGGPEVDTITLANPLRVDSLEDLIVAILNIFITLMIPIIVIFIIFAGFKYVTAQGNAGKVEEATTTLTYAIIGGVLILAAVAIAEIIKNTVGAFAV
jgi:TRAP-type C4-dicarboxylate transport system permease small subunit